MITIERERAGGKTYRLVQEMLKPGNEDMVYVAPTRSQAIDIGLRTAIEQGAENTRELRARFVTGAQLPEAVRGRKVRLVIDEADGVLGYLLGAPIALIAHTPREAAR